MNEWKRHSLLQHKQEVSKWQNALLFKTDTILSPPYEISMLTAQRREITHLWIPQSGPLLLPFLEVMTSRRNRTWNQHDLNHLNDCTYFCLQNSKLNSNSSATRKCIHPPPKKHCSHAQTLFSPTMRLPTVKAAKSLPMASKAWWM